MKKILCFVSVFFLCTAAMTPSFAETAKTADAAEINGFHAAVAEGFNLLGEDGEGAMPFYRTTGDVTVGLKNLKGSDNKSLVFESGARGGAAFYQKTSTEVANGSIIFEFDLMINDKDSRTDFSLYNGRYKRKSFCSIKDGVLYYGGKTVAELENGRWYKFTFAVDPAAKNAQIFTDKEKVKDESFDGADFLESGARGVHIGFAAESASEVAVDDIRIYEGSERYANDYDFLTIGEKVNLAYGSGVIFKTDTAVSYIKTKKKNITDLYPLAPFEQGGDVYVPLRITAESFGGAVGWNGETGAITVDCDGIRSELKIGQSEYTVGGVAEKAENPVKDIFGTTFVPSKTAARILSKKVCTVGGVAIIDSKEHSAELDGTIFNEVSEWLMKDKFLGNQPRGEVAYVKQPAETKYNIVGIEASDSDQNVPANVADGNLETRWSANLTAWITLDLGEIKPVGEVDVAVHEGASRSNVFDILVSDDGKVWQTVLITKSAKQSADYEVFKLPQIYNARYVRYKGYGADVSTYNSVAEIAVLP